MKDIVDILTKNKKTISSMESCTGGAFAYFLTNVEGASNVIKYSAVTYSNEYKIKMGVDEDIINKYTVYSFETADEMSKKISLFANSNYGVGITGQINRIDENNITDNDNLIFVSIYDRDNDKFYHKELTAINDNRENNKKYIIDNVIDMLKGII
ncbi:MAG: CinA family protein [Bacilli bacterium]|nr:CinA family protein [Bacilli bacterium]